ncbi:MAG: hypothetical protein JSR50_03135 [Proteobacteria bacterium]|nr:hypothetical protein [Pseudomonadota bacterium]
MLMLFMIGVLDIGQEMEVGKFDAKYQADIRWPSSDRVVRYLDYSGYKKVLNDGCLVRYSSQMTTFFRMQSHRVRMGEVCGKLVVLSSYPLTKIGGMTKKRLEFIAKHEMFHIAFQTYGYRLPIEYIGVNDAAVTGELISDQATSGVISFGRVLYNELRNKNKNKLCANLGHEYEKLEIGQKAYLKYKIFWEWPAETYAFESLSWGGIPAYLNFRKHLFASWRDNYGIELYMAGPLVAQILDRRSRGWWREVADGQSMMYLFMKSIHCPLSSEFHVDTSNSVLISKQALFEKTDEEMP